MGNSASYSGNSDDGEFSHDSSYDSESYSDESSFRSSEEEDDDLVVVNTHDANQEKEEEEERAKDESIAESSPESLEAFWKDLLGWMETFVYNTKLSLEGYVTRDLIVEHMSQLPEVAFVLRQTTDNKDFVTELEKQYTPIAFKILDQCHDIKNIRFQLVPAKIKEHAFWATVFMLIWDRYKNDNDDQQDENKNEDTTKDSPEDEPSSPEVTKVAALSSTYRSSFQQIMNGGHGSAMHVNDSLKRIIKEKTWQILQLEKDLEQARETVRRLEEKQKQQDQQNLNGYADATTVEKEEDLVDQAPQHVGTWVLTQDAQDFLALDEEIKQNLRQEKKKRLQDVRQQMKFILDSDHVADSCGEWDCCHATVYSSECSCDNSATGGGKACQDTMTRHVSM